MIEGLDLVTKLFHMGERTKFDMTRPVPQISDVSQLTSLNVLEQFERITKEIIQTDDGEVALLARRVLEDNLLPQCPQVRQSPPQIYGRYQKLIALLKFMNLVIYSRREISVLIKENLLSALQIGMLVKDKFRRVLKDYDDILMEGAIAEELANSMMVCEEKLGDSPILLEDGNKTIPQTIGNWLKDYIQRSLAGVEHSTGSLERISYFQKNPNAQKLTLEEKKSLSEVFHLYDWLRYGELSVSQDSEDTPYFIAQKLESPKEILEPGQKQASLKTVPSAQALPQAVSDWQAPQKPVREATPTQDMNIQDILKGRKREDKPLTSDLPSLNNAPPSPLSQKEKEKGAGIDIDQKLEELSKKVKQRLGKK